MKEDYSRIWIIIPVWVSFPFLLVHFIHSMPTLFSVTVIGIALHVDYAIVSVNMHLLLGT